MNHDDELVAFLKKELLRVGRKDVTVTSGPNGTVTLTAIDGSWSGPAAAARLALDRTPAGHGVRAGFWALFPQ